MGCVTHSINGRLVRFSEDDDDWRCLCTFPHNDGNTLDTSRLRSLALFGAVCAMIESQDEFYSGYEVGDYIFLPHNAPDWLKSEIQRLIPEE